MSYADRRLAVPDPRVPGAGGRLLFAAVAGGFSLLLRLLARLTVHGGTLPGGGLVVILNHRSVADGPLSAVLGRRVGRQLRLLGTAGVFTVPVVGWVLLSAGIVPVKRRTGQAREALDGAKRMLLAGEAVGLFPEGGIGRAPDGLPAPLKTGAARLALGAQVPVVAIGVTGAERLVPPGTWRVSPRRPRLLARVSAPLDLCAAVGLAPGVEPSEEQVDAATLLLHALLASQLR